MSIEATLPRRSTSPGEGRSEKRAVTAYLPWFIAGAALLIYLLTLNTWVSLFSLGQVAQTAGWTWQPPTNEPLYWLATLPFRVLPETWVPLALNLLSALCAALTLALLARSIAILPHNRTEDQRLRERHPKALLSIPLAWLPPVVGVVICGFQLTFWENATAASSEMLNLLIAAYLIRCLLEFRLDGRQVWMLKASFVYAAAMANNWAMVAYFPLFLLAIMWIKGLEFFNLSFLMRMFVCGVAGLMFYLLLPILAAMSDYPVTFWQSLRENLTGQKNMILGLFQTRILFNPDKPQWILALASLVPLLLISIRWPSSFGDPSKLGMAISSIAFHLVHGVLLAYCIWIAFDPAISPRNHSFAPPGLTLYYLGALAIGYLVGYFLLVFGTKVMSRVRQQESELQQLANRVVVGLVLILVLGATVLLPLKNGREVNLTNGRWGKSFLREYVDYQATNLPPGAIALSDDYHGAWLLQSVGADRSRNILPVVTGSLHLQLPWYNHYLRSRYPGRWTLNTTNFIEQPVLATNLFNLAASTPVYYLHPSFGYYFEVLTPSPAGTLVQLTRYPSNAIVMPPLSAEVIETNLVRWSAIDQNTLKHLVEVRLAARRGSVDDFLVKTLKTQPETNRTAIALGSWYSRSLTYWGVELQKAGRLVEARNAFSRALDLNPENLAARVNLDCNKKLQAGEKLRVPAGSAPGEDDFGRYGTWEHVMSANGPFDEPLKCTQQGTVFFRNKNYAQSAQLFARASELAPDEPLPQMSLATLYVLIGMPDAALTQTGKWRAKAGSSLSTTNIAELLYVEASALLYKKDAAGAANAIATALKATTNSDVVLAIASSVYQSFGQFSNAIPLVELRLQRSPDDPQLLAKKGLLLMGMNQLEQAIEVLSQAMKLEKNSTSETYLGSLYNRATVYRRLNRLAEAEADYNQILAAIPTHDTVHLSLGQIAEQKNDVKGAIAHYEVYLSNVDNTNTMEASQAMQRLQELKKRGST